MKNICFFFCQNTSNMRIRRYWSRSIGFFLILIGYAKYMLKHPRGEKLRNVSPREQLPYVYASSKGLELFLIINYRTILFQ